MQRHLIRLVKKTLRRLGVEMNRYSVLNNSSLRRALIMNQYDINIVFDVGANEGQYAEEIRELGYKGAIHSFEPIPSAYQKLSRKAAKDSQWQPHFCAVGDASGKAIFNISANSVSSSLLKMEAMHESVAPESRFISTIEVPVKPLDDFISVISPADRLWIKLDVQGYEKKVCEGAPQLLSRAMVVESELSLVRLYSESPLISQMIGEFDRLGFELYNLDIGCTDPQSGRVCQVNGTFVKRSAARLQMSV